MIKFTIAFQRCEEGGFTAQIKEVKTNEQAMKFRQATNQTPPVLGS
jgi:hypothetical protein